MFLTEHSGDPAEAYDLAISGGGGVTISGGGAAGTFYGEQSVEQILKGAADHATLPVGSTHETPVQSERGLMIDTAREYWPVATLEQAIRHMAWMKLNTFHWHVTDSEAFRLRLPGYAGLAAARSYTPADVHAIETYARRYHVTVIPEQVRLSGRTRPARSTLSPAAIRGTAMKGCGQFRRASRLRPRLWPDDQPNVASGPRRRGLAPPGGRTVRWERLVG